MQVQITDHARLRIQQRGIHEDAIPILLKYGKKVHDNKGGRILFFNKESRQRIERECGTEMLGRLRDRMDIYAVLSESNGVVTVGHRFKRIKRH